MEKSWVDFSEMEKLACRDVRECSKDVIRLSQLIKEKVARVLADVTFLKERFSKNGEQNEQLLEDFESLLYDYAEEILPSMDNVFDVALEADNDVDNITKVIYSGQKNSLQ